MWALPSPLASYPFPLLTAQRGYTRIFEYSSIRSILSSKLFDINSSNPHSTDELLSPVCSLFSSTCCSVRRLKVQFAKHQMSVQARFVGHLHECVTLCCSAFFSFFTGLLLSRSPSASPPHAMHTFRGCVVVQVNRSLGQHKAMHLTLVYTVYWCILTSHWWSGVVVTR